jgi:RNA polymerase sigma-70 factor (ECF subfamily)
MDRSELKACLERGHCESYGWALCCCSRDPIQAEEVLQRVYLSVLEGKARYQGRAAFKTWLFAVIRKTAADERRRNWLRRLRLIRYGERARTAAAEERPERDPDRDELRAMFLRVLDALPLRQRQVLHLVFYHDLSLSEAAEAMGLAVGSARTHYDRAKKALRGRLKDTVLDETGLGTREDQGALPRPEARG